jgi:hypothetical protein
VGEYFADRIDAFAKCRRFWEERDDPLNGLHGREKQHLVYDYVADGDCAFRGE